MLRSARWDSVTMEVLLGFYHFVFMTIWSSWNKKSLKWQGFIFLVFFPPVFCACQFLSSYTLALSHLYPIPEMPLDSGMCWGQGRGQGTGWESTMSATEEGGGTQRWMGLKPEFTVRSVFKSRLCHLAALHPRVLLPLGKRGIRADLPHRPMPGPER